LRGSHSKDNGHNESDENGLFDDVIELRFMSDGFVRHFDSSAVLDFEFPGPSTAAIRRDAGLFLEGRICNAVPETEVVARLLLGTVLRAVSEVRLRGSQMQVSKEHHIRGLKF